MEAYVVVEAALPGDGSDELLQAINVVNRADLAGGAGTAGEFVEGGHDVVRLLLVYD